MKLRNLMNVGPLLWSFLLLSLPAVASDTGLAQATPLIGRPATEADPSLQSAEGVEPEQWQSVYVDKGRPGLALLLQRRLTDEVREFETDSRRVRLGNNYRDVEADPDARFDVISRQRRLDELNASGAFFPDHDWLSRFDAVLTSTLVAAGTRLVDRTLAMRTSMADVGRETTYQPVQLKMLELEALRQRATFLAQIEFFPSTSARSGWRCDVSLLRLDRAESVGRISREVRVDVTSEDTDSFVSSPGGGYERGTRIVSSESHASQEAEDLSTELRKLMLTSLSTDP